MIRYTANTITLSTVTRSFMLTTTILQHGRVQNVLKTCAIQYSDVKSCSMLDVFRVQHLIRKPD
jgi:hypothetical protein